jgi:O-antigen/teichoic acid export membrane protein
MAEAALATLAGAGAGVGRGLLERLAKGAVLALGIQVAGAGLAYLSQVALARWMGVSQFGLYAYLIAWTTVLALIAGLGFPISVLRFLPEYEARGEAGRRRGLIVTSRAMTLAAAVSLAALCAGVALAFSTTAPVAIALAAGLVPLGALINLDSAIARAGGRVAKAYAPNLLGRPALVLLGVGVAWLATGRLDARAALAVTLAAFATVALIQTRFTGQLMPRADARYERRRWLRVSGPLLLVAGFQVALSQTDLLIVGAVAGVRNAAFYSVASRTALLVSYLLVAVSAVMAPLFSELEARGDRAGLQRLASVSAQWTFWPTLALAAGLAALAPFVLGLFGPHYQSARWALLILLVGQLVNAGCGAVGYLLSMTGHQDDTARVYGITAVVNFALCYAGVRLLKLEGAAVATSVSLMAWNLWLSRLTVKRLGVRASLLACVVTHRQERSRSDGH